MPEYNLLGVDESNDLPPAVFARLQQRLGSTGGGALVEDPPGSGLYSPSGAGVTEDPANPGLYLI